MGTLEGLNFLYKNLSISTPRVTSGLELNLSLKMSQEATKIIQSYIGCHPNELVANNLVKPVELRWMQLTTKATGGL